MVGRGERRGSGNGRGATGVIVDRGESKEAGRAIILWKGAADSPLLSSCDFDYFDFDFIFLAGGGGQDFD